MSVLQTWTSAGGSRQRGRRALLAPVLATLTLAMASLDAGAASAATMGKWQLLADEAPVLPIHAALLRTGRVWLASGSSNDAAQFAAGIFRTVTFDPVTETYDDISTPWDVFCAGHSFLADGRLLVAGGTTGYPTADHFFQGSSDAYLFDPATDTYGALPDMTSARWYPTAVTLGLGSVYVLAGIDGSGNGDVVDPEIYSPGTGTWTALPPTDVWPLYPSLTVTTTPGRLFYSGSYVFQNKGVQAGFLDWTSSTITPVGGLREPDQRDQSMTVLLPPAQDQRVMVIGGGSPPPPVGLGVAIDDVDIVDLDAPQPAYAAGPPLANPRMHVSAVVLPDRTVVAIGGGRIREGDPVYAAEVYDPVANSWRTLASGSVPRLYHSFALLLPDGRVLVGGNNPDGVQDKRIEIFSPPYLFKGQRPVIAAAPTVASYGGTSQVQVTQAQKIATVSLVRPAAVTHSMDTEQRLVDVPFTRSGDSLLLSIPADPLLAPPGWYMLFAVNKQGIPSVASWIRIGP